MIPTLTIHNGEAISLHQIPVLEYDDFVAYLINAFKNNSVHCLNYYVLKENECMRFICLLADDQHHKIDAISHIQPNGEILLHSITEHIYAFHVFEREIAENMGVQFMDHPWLKPIRWPHDRANKNSTPDNYPFFSIEGTETHEVGVGPIHAGVIEPGHFRFSCYGELVKHLEIHNGYQHRGIEYLFLQKNNLIQQTVLAESIAGDCVVGHTLSFVQTIEALGGIQISQRTMLLRTLALELERIAIHVGDLSALCLDVGYQLGSSVFGGLRTPIINFFQLWCGNRFAKGLIRVGYLPFDLNAELISKLHTQLVEFEKRYLEMAEKTFSLASVMNRFDKTGIVSAEQAQLIGAVGMAARSSGLKRDLRISHPHLYYAKLPIHSTIQKGGDVFSRGKLRDLEIRHSIQYIFQLLKTLGTVQVENSEKRITSLSFSPNQWAFSAVESWRGEIVHCATTDQNGKLVNYKIKDPSLHNWMALALSVRNNEISDFPICNKSYDLSYCGNDL